MTKPGESTTLTRASAQWRNRPADERYSSMPELRTSAHLYRENSHEFLHPLREARVEVDGYYAPLAAAYADVSLEQKQERRDLNAVGHAKQTSLTGRFLGGPQIYAQDIWVNKHADQRYNIQPVKVEAHMRGVPIVATVELRLLPPDDVVYQLGVT
jgi:hypothetical protein